MAETIAIVGASRDRGKFGNKAVRAYLSKGFVVYPVNPRESEIEGQTAYPDLASVPGEVDRVALYVPPAVGILLLDAIAAKRPQKFFVNPGTGSPELIEQARALGLHPMEACAIRAIGISPAQLDPPPDAGGSPGKPQ